jgi:hypothetical protein
LFALDAATTTAHGSANHTARRCADTPLTAWA